MTPTPAFDPGEHLGPPEFQGEPAAIRWESGPVAEALSGTVCKDESTVQTTMRSRSVAITVAVFLDVQPRTVGLDEQADDRDAVPRAP